ncbi:DUF6266 family protein [Cloacibacterium sp. TD35]|uniref:DUF6266 family protein n=1 Tax=Cloacibacterium sp. TD35 TaxID=2976818 RepID=UPI00237D78F9|nr:DUF6266 family protein [Cloacibacterium sp. TD35]WDT68806.1 DUF6266 family protein [Cloacibacterium sp. TD35]
MGKIKTGILGGFQGKVGTVIGSTWRGESIMRALPKSAAKAPSELQKLQRLKFKAVSEFLNPLRTTLSTYFGNDTGVKSKYNMATSYHITNAVEVTNEVAQILYSRVLVAKGTLFGFQNLTSTHADTNIALQWEDNTIFGNAKAEDTVNVVCYSEEVNTFYVFENIATRDGLTATVTLPQNFIGYDVEVYAFLYDSASKTASNSVYLGNIAL